MYFLAKLKLKDMQLSVVKHIAMSFQEEHELLHPQRRSLLGTSGRQAAEG